MHIHNRLGQTEFLQIFFLFSVKPDEEIVYFSKKNLLTNKFLYKDINTFLVDTRKYITLFWLFKSLNTYVKMHFPQRWLLKLTSEINYCFQVYYV